MELLKGGELLELIRKIKISEKQAVVIMKQIISAVCFLHQNNIVHRDIKPEVGICFIIILIKFNNLSQIYIMSKFSNHNNKK